MSATAITERRRLTIEGVSDTTDWMVDEFDNGRAYILSITNASGTFRLGAHFTTREQWAEFQKLVAGGES